jgi:hypothetical protein
MKAGLWVSSDGTAGEYAQRARRAAEGAARRAAAPLIAVRQQKLDLESARGELEHTQAALAAARTELDVLRSELAAARRNADGRRAATPVESVIEQEVARQPDQSAPALRDVALALADLEVNRTPGVVVVVVDDPADGTAARAVIAAAVASERTVVADADADGVTLDEPVALAYLADAAYDRTLTWLQRLAPLVVSGGRLVLDRYPSSADARAAVDQYFRDRRMDFRWEQHSRLHVVRR